MKIPKNASILSIDDLCKKGKHKSNKADTICISSSEAIRPQHELELFPLSN